MPSHNNGAGDITIRVKGVNGAETITTKLKGVSARNYSKGNTEVTVTDVNITTTDTDVSSFANGVEGVSILGHFGGEPDGRRTPGITSVTPSSPD